MNYIQTKSFKRVKLYIDCENMSYCHINSYLGICEQEGVLVQMRCYGVFSNPVLRQWEAFKSISKHFISHEVSLELCNVSFRGTGKNAADEALIEDLNKDFLENQDDVYVLVAEDTDYEKIGNLITSSGGNIINITKKFHSNNMSKFFTQTYCISEISCDKYVHLPIRENLISIMKNILRMCITDNLHVQLSIFTQKLYEVLRKEYVQLILGYSANKGICKKIIELEEFYIYTNDSVNFIALNNDSLK